MNNLPKLHRKSYQALGLALGLLIQPACPARAQTLATSDASSYLFVSTRMPRQTLLALARDSVRTRATLVLRGGLESGATGLQRLRRYVLDNNAQCCAQQPAAWVIDPVLFERFQVRAAPTFVLALDASGQSGSYVAVAGDMEWANALKFMAQGAASPALRARASALYHSAFEQE